MVHKGNGVQVIYGPRVTVIKSNLEDYLETAPDEEVTENAGETVKEQQEGKKEQAGKVVESVTIYSPVTGTAADLS